jgi:hypothetical protein
MIKMLVSFLSLFAIFFFGIEIFRKLSGKEKWVLTKTLGYSIVCAVLTILALTAVVLVF